MIYRYSKHANVLNNYIFNKINCLVIPKSSYSASPLPDHLKNVPEAEDPSFFRMVEYFVHNAIEKLDKTFLDSLLERNVTSEQLRIQKKEGIVNLMKNCSAVIEVRFPIKRDDGSYAMITGYRAHHSTHRLPLKGGLLSRIFIHIPVYFYF